MLEHKAATSTYDIDMKNSPFLKVVALILVFAFTILVPDLSKAAEQLVIFDNDWINETALVSLLAAPNVKVLGVVVTTGNEWRDEEADDVLRFFESMHISDVPVTVGAVYPMINSAARMEAWEKMYGQIPWKGAFNADSAGPQFHPDQPSKITVPKDGLPRYLKISSTNAVEFMIEQVHAHPHEVTIFAGGPLTNIALAIRIDPDFSRLSKGLVFMGGNLKQIKDNGKFASDFNFMFDPEAAHIALTADWPKIICVGDVSGDIGFPKSLVTEMQKKDSLAVQYFARHESEIGPWAWEDLAAAIIVDPTLVTDATDLTMDVDIDHGMNYGRARVWPLSRGPKLGDRPVTVVSKVDTARFFSNYVQAAQSLGIRQ
ncbi:inosine-uridine nucleoside N-ribohydrolase [Paraburkholderia silvatlantica]|uniref:Inosine-uridine nucleoside N-ribohydrolase n=1 Tax=Paraburkholderia silvatlantica TaxID=321895 RepID=A0A2V4T8X9_9BURK|nr:nucleoside hydrolase [Paraburkholderia silvatlantica]PYE18404.1 inosine-uridine nucleoside N-ribohydrolase [Paraburkholderia silvatlantica]